MTSDQDDDTSSSNASDASEHYHPKSASRTSVAKRRHKPSSITVMDGYKFGDPATIEPCPFDGYALKKREKPMKGWHKRYFTFRDGIMEYKRIPGEGSKSRVRGRCDLAQCFISYDRARRKIYIDTGMHVYRLKIKDQNVFETWVRNIQNQRKLRQKLILEKSDSIGETSISVLRTTENIQSALNIADESFRRLEEIYKKLQPLTSSSSGDEMKELQKKFVEESKEVYNGLSDILTKLKESSQKTHPHGYLRRMNTLFYDAVEELYDSENSSNSNNEANSESTVKEQPGDDEKNRTTPQHRITLPARTADYSSLNTFSLLKQCIGKDVSRISFPIVLSEPLSTLQGICENFQYSELLDKACECDNPALRLVYVAAFVISSYSFKHYRTRIKCFNPVQSETYEYIIGEKGIKFIAEQVCHHPNISAAFCEGKGFTYEEDFRLKVSFWGKSVEVTHLGKTRLSIKRLNEQFEWQNAGFLVHNLLSDNKSVEMCGNVKITSSSSYSAKITFLKNRDSDKQNQFVGRVFDKLNNVVHEYYGKWHLDFNLAVGNTSECIWKIEELPSTSAEYYGFTRFTFWLNEVNDDMREKLPKTDSRLRPDIRFVENGDLDAAAAAKTKLEEMQRTRTLQPRWFELKDDFWTFNHLYWVAKENNDFLSIPPLFE